jgi:hypothetical protein
MLHHGRDRRVCLGSDGQRAIEWRAAPSSRLHSLPMIFRDIIDTVRNPDRGPILVHCWNGLHYAGMVSALALRQFCGLSAAQAEAYWRANANRGANYPLIIANLRNFKPIPDLSLTPEEQLAVCPNLTKSYLVTPEAFMPVPLPGVMAAAGATPTPEAMTRASEQSLPMSLPMPLSDPAQRVIDYGFSLPMLLELPVKLPSPLPNRTAARPGKG